MDNMIVSVSPHIHAKDSTQTIMRDVLIALVPGVIASVVFFGARALLVEAVCVAAAMFFEWAFEKICKRPNTVGDLSAAVTGLILAFNLPVGIPLWQAAFGSLVAIVVVKQLFGGLGQNFANPAITARIVLFLGFTTQMTTWPLPRNQVSVDAITGPTPLGILAEGGGTLPSNLDMFLGFIGGSMGEISAAALLLGGLYLIYRDVISPTTPVAFIGTVAVFALLAGQDPVFHICAGGVMLGAFFMATDYATTPITTMGKVIFGIGCGLITMLIRVFGAYPEGVSFSILLMNILTPHIDNFCIKRLYGGGKKA